VSRNLKEETRKTFHIEKEIEVIYNFVDVQRFTRKGIDAFRKVIAPNGERILLHASNFRKIKRVQDVVNIFFEVQKKIPAKLLFVGDGPERQTAEELGRRLGICDEMRFVGKQEQMEDILAIADLFLLTSEYESFGLAALEAMAAGVPVVSTNAGGLSEINVEGVTGFMANVGDVETMSRRSLEILEKDKVLESSRPMRRSMPGNSTSPISSLSTRSSTNVFSSATSSVWRPPYFLNQCSGFTLSLSFMSMKSTWPLAPSCDSPTFPMTWPVFTTVPFRTVTADKLL
jgi:N-acetyl-alpha-D-glucosaminyl L-malate synthase BshA